MGSVVACMMSDEHGRESDVYEGWDDRLGNEGWW